MSERRAGRNRVFFKKVRKKAKKGDFEGENANNESNGGETIF